MGRVPFSKPLVASLCGTFLKPEMQSVYRQIAGLRRYRTVVFTEKRIHAEQFRFDPVVTMEKPPPALRVKRRKQRQRGNFIRRFYYKHLLKQWPPPEKPKPALPAPPPTLVYDDPYNLVDLLRERHPALAHVYYGHKAVKYLPMLQRWGGPLIVSFHGVDVTEAVYKPNDPATIMEVFAHAKLILGRSQSLLARLETMGCPPEKLRLNRAAIPLEHIPCAVRQVPVNGQWRFLQACRLIAKKGLISTLLAMRQVLTVWPQARLTLAGDGPMAEQLRDECAKLGIASSVEFTGWCSQEKLFALYNQSHLFLHPSEMTEGGDQEGVPNSLLEAMASGLPAVATRHGGIPEAVTDGLDGLLVPEKSPDRLGEAILRFTRDSVLFDACSRHAAISVAEKFGAERQIQALEDCYTEVLG